MNDFRIIPFGDGRTTQSCLRNGTITTTGLSLTLMGGELDLQVITSRKETARGHITVPADPDYLARLIEELRYFEILLRSVREPNS